MAIKRLKMAKNKRTVILSKDGLTRVKVNMGSGRYEYKTMEEAKKISEGRKSMPRWVAYSIYEGMQVGQSIGFRDRDWALRIFLNIDRLYKIRLRYSDRRMFTDTNETRYVGKRTMNGKTFGMSEKDGLVLIWRIQ